MDLLQGKAQPFVDSAENDLIDHLSLILSLEDAFVMQHNGLRQKKVAVCLAPEVNLRNFSLVHRAGRAYCTPRSNFLHTEQFAPVPPLPWQSHWVWR